MTRITTIFLAGTFSVLMWLKNNRASLISMIVWPYLMSFTIMFLGTVLGNPSTFATRMGIDNPFLYVLAGGGVAISCLAVVDSVANSVVFHRWLGTLQYLLLTPVATYVVLLIEPLPGALITSTIPLLSIVPGAIVFGGVAAALRVIAALAFVYLAMIPLAGFSVILATISLMMRQEGHGLSFVTPAMLLLSGVFYPVSALPKVLQVLSWFIPPRYAVEATRIIVSISHPEIRPVVMCVLAIASLSILYNTISIPMLRAVDRWIKRCGAV